MAFFIEAANDETASHSSGVLTRDQNERERRIDALNRDISIDAGHSEWSILNINKLFQHLVIECKLVNIVDTVWKDAHQVRTSTTIASLGCTD